MKYLIITILGLFLVGGVAYAATFDFSNGQPGVMDDGTVSDTFEQTRYDFTNGQPTPVLDSTATQAASVSYQSTLVINDLRGGMLIINDTRGGSLIIQ